MWAMATFTWISYVWELGRDVATCSITMRNIQRISSHRHYATHDKAGVPLGCFWVKRGRAKNSISIIVGAGIQLRIELRRRG